MDSWDSDNKGDDKVACPSEIPTCLSHGPRIVSYKFRHIYPMIQRVHTDRQYSGKQIPTPETRVFRKKMDDPEVARSGHPRNDETPWDASWVLFTSYIQHKEILSIGMYWDVLGMASFPASSIFLTSFPPLCEPRSLRVVAVHPRYSFLWNFAKKELFLIEARWKKTGLMRCPATTKPISPSLQSPRSARWIWPEAEASGKPTTQLTKWGTIRGSNL